MKQLLFFELKKLWGLRVLLLLAAFVIQTIGVANMHRQLDFGIVQTRMQEYVALRVEQSGPIDEKKATAIRERFEENGWDGYAFTFGSKIYGDPVSWAMERDYMFADQWLNRFYEGDDIYKTFMGMNALQNVKQQIQLQSTQATYQERALLLQEEMMSKLPPPGFYEGNVISSMYDSTFNRDAVVLLIIILVFVLSPIFCSEASYGMDALILSSQGGRARIVWAKVMAALLFTICFVTFACFISIGIHALFFGGAMGLYDPINSIRPFTFSPYLFVHWQAILAQYGMMLLGSLGVCACILIVSALLKSTLSSLLFSFVFLFAPLAVYDFTSAKIYSFFPSRLMVSRDYFSHFRAVNIFGSPVLFPIIGGILTCVITAVCCAFMKKAYLRRLAG